DRLHADHGPAGQLRRRAGTPNRDRLPVGVGPAEPVHAHVGSGDGRAGDRPGRLWHVAAVCLACPRDVVRAQRRDAGDRRADLVHGRGEPKIVRKEHGTMAFNLRHRDFAELLDFTPKEIWFLLKLAEDLKAAKYGGYEQPRLVGKNIALIFEKASTRTRCAFEIAAHDQGAHVTYLGPGETQIGHKESMKTPARVLIP